MERQQSRRWAEEKAAGQRWQSEGKCNGITT